jgi:hypothetical protein
VPVTVNERPLALSDNERAMIELAKEHSSRVIILLNVDNPIEIDELKRDDDIDAILWCGLPGVNGFLGVADTLSGSVNPSGPLPARAITFLNASLMSAALITGISPMVNQLGFVVAGLDTMSTISALIIFAVLAGISMLLNVVASFLI